MASRASTAALRTEYMTLAEQWRSMAADADALEQMRERLAAENENRRHSARRNHGTRVWPMTFN
jgi:hypothetical protein